MFFRILRDQLFPLLKMAVSVVGRKQFFPILNNVLVKVKDNTLHLTATDAEVEITCTIPLEPSLETSNEGETTIPARKFYDFIKSVPKNAVITVTEENERATIKSGKSRLTLSCLPAQDFPNSVQVESILTFKLPQHTLKDLFTQTAFAMATADVRYYLNGVLLDLMANKLVVVATNGHRLALATELLETREHTPIQVIIPRKAVVELTRVLDNSDNEVEIFIDNTYIKIAISNTLAISSKLIDGKFPDYQGVLPANPDKKVSIDTASLKTSLSQLAASIDAEYKIASIFIKNNRVIFAGKNRVALIECEVDYTGEELEIGFNVTYLQDALNAITTSEVQISFSNANSGFLIQPKGIDTIKYIVMPCRL